MWKFIKKAFVNRWNFLALFGGVGFSVVSGRPDIFLPLVCAAEIGYLGLLGTHPKFQRHVLAQEAKVNRAQNSQNVQVVLQQILQQLPRESLARYERLRRSCLELRQIAQDLHKTGTIDADVPLESFQLAGLDRLMWIFLRLQFTQFSLGRFLERASADRMRMDIRQAEQRLAQIQNDSNVAHNERMRHTLTDNLETCKARLANYEKAQANYELVELELDRLENKIKSLAEIGINRQEPNFISSQVDHVAQSMMDTEKTINELQFATGLNPLEDDIPEILQQSPIQIVE